MVKRVVWTKRAAEEKRRILAYWSKRNGNKSYSHKLNIKFKETLRNIAELNYLGKDTGYKKIRVTIVESYLIFYSSHETQIDIISVFDGRRDPDDLKLDT